MEDVRHLDDYGIAAMDASMEEMMTTHECPQGVCDNAPAKICTLLGENEDPMLEVDEDTHHPYDKR